MRCPQFFPDVSLVFFQPFFAFLPPGIPLLPLALCVRLFFHRWPASLNVGCFCPAGPRQTNPDAILPPHPHVVSIVTPQPFSGPPIALRFSSSHTLTFFCEHPRHVFEGAISLFFFFFFFWTCWPCPLRNPLILCASLRTASPLTVLTFQQCDL